MTNTRKILAGAIAAAALAATSVYAADNARPGPGWGDCGNAAAGAGYGPRNGMGPGAGFGPDSGHGHSMMGQGPGRSGHGGYGAFGSGNPAAMAAGHLAALKVELKITREQEGAWEKFATKASKQAESMPAQREQMFAQMSAKDVPAPERLTQRTEIAKQHLAQMETMTVAVKDMYAALTPEQKKIADDLLTRGPMGGHGGMGGPGGMGRGHGFRS